MLPSLSFHRGSTPGSGSRWIWLKVKSAYLRITLTRVTLAFFLFSFIHCLTQGVIQSFLFTVDAEFGALFTGIVNAADLPPKDFVFVEGTKHHYRLTLCNNVPLICTTIFEAGDALDSNSTIDFSGFRRSNQVFSRDLEANALIFDTPTGALAVQPLNGTSNVTIDGVQVMYTNGTTRILDQQCTRTLLYPEQVLRFARREDLASVAVQFWLFSVSFFAIMYDSIPHTLAVLAARVLTTAWSAYTIWRTTDFEVKMNQLVADDGTPCNINLLQTYFSIRMGYQIPDLLLNFTALVLTAYCSRSLLKMYKEQTFKCIGAPHHITRIYKFFMAVLACLQLSVLVFLSFMALWTDELFNTAIRKISLHTNLYVTLIITTTILLIPWISMGWYSIRNERKHLMAAFLVIAFILMGGWALMFWSQVYRWTFVCWAYLACLAVSSFILLIATLVLGGVCWLNFNKGLAEYLYAEDRLAALDFEPDVHDIEKAPRRDSMEKIPLSPLPPPRAWAGSGR